MRRRPPLRPAPSSVVAPMDDDLVLSDDGERPIKREPGAAGPGGFAFSQGVVDLTQSSDEDDVANEAMFEDGAQPEYSRAVRDEFIESTLGYSTSDPITGKQTVEHGVGHVTRRQGYGGIETRRELVTDDEGAVVPLAPGAAKPRKVDIGPGMTTRLATVADSISGRYVEDLADEGEDWMGYAASGAEVSAPGYTMGNESSEDEPEIQYMGTTGKLSQRQAGASAERAELNDILDAASDDDGFDYDKGGTLISGERAELFGEADPFWYDSGVRRQKHGALG